MVPVLAYHERMRVAFADHGPWWPAESPFEIMVGAVLVQNTNWLNVAKAVARLRDADVLDPHRLRALTPEQLEALITPAGTFRIKGRRLRVLTDWLLARCDGDVSALAGVATSVLREELVALHGIGPETADAILCYALGRPVLAVDAYTARIAVRHRLIDPPFDYDELQAVMSHGLPSDDATLQADIHKEFIQVAKRWCRKPAPQCDGCPLQPELQGKPPRTDE